MGTITSCCCGCTLGQGVVGVGIVSLIRSIAMLLVGATWVQNSAKGQGNSDDNAWEVESQKLKVIGYFGWTYIIDGLLLTVVSFFLFFAVSRKFRGYLYPWLVWEGIVLAMILLMFTYNYLTGEVSMFAIFICVLSSITTAYLYTVVLAFNNHLKENMVDHVSLRQKIILKYTFVGDAANKTPMTRDPHEHHGQCLYKPEVTTPTNNTTTFVPNYTPEYEAETPSPEDKKCPLHYQQSPTTIMPFAEYNTPPLYTKVTRPARPPRNQWKE